VTLKEIPHTAGCLENEKRIMALEELLHTNPEQLEVLKEVYANGQLWKAEFMNEILLKLDLLNERIDKLKEWIKTYVKNTNTRVPIN
jgi:hypothetical protein